MSTEYIEHLASQRTDLHEEHVSHKFSDDYEIIGIAGEMEFGKFSGIMPDLSMLPGGDDGIDFTIPLMFTVDVKTFKKPLNLIHKVGKPFADIFVLAGYEEDGAVTLLGWEWGSKLKAAPTREFGYGVENHYIPQEKLKPMKELTKRLGRLRPANVGI